MKKKMTFHRLSKLLDRYMPFFLGNSAKLPFAHFPYFCYLNQAQIPEQKHNNLMYFYQQICSLPFQAHKRTRCLACIARQFQLLEQKIEMKCCECHLIRVCRLFVFIYIIIYRSALWNLIYIHKYTLVLLQLEAKLQKLLYISLELPTVPILSMWKAW